MGALMMVRCGWGLRRVRLMVRLTLMVLTRFLGMLWDLSLFGFG